MTQICNVKSNLFKCHTFILLLHFEANKHFLCVLIVDSLIVIRIICYLIAFFSTIFFSLFFFATWFPSIKIIHSHVNASAWHSFRVFPLTHSLEASAIESFDWRVAGTCYRFSIFSRNFLTRSGSGSNSKHKKWIITSENYHTKREKSTLHLVWRRLIYASQCVANLWCDSVHRIQVHCKIWCHMFHVQN